MKIVPQVTKRLFCLLISIILPNITRINQSSALRLEQQSMKLLTSYLITKTFLTATEENTSKQDFQIAEQTLQVSTILIPPKRQQAQICALKVITAQLHQDKTEWRSLSIHVLLVSDHLPLVLLLNMKDVTLAKPAILAERLKLRLE